MPKRTLKDLATYLESLVALGLPEQRTSQRAVQAAEIILVDLLRVTPVDTSKAISNWQVSVDEPARQILPPYVPGAQGSTALASQEIALSVGKQVLAAKKPGQRIFISNPLPYIRRLNDGHSKQAPAGFIERAVLIARLFAEGKIETKVA